MVFERPNYISAAFLSLILDFIGPNADSTFRRLNLLSRQGELAAFPTGKPNRKWRRKNFRKKNWRRSGLRGGCSISKRDRAASISFSMRQCGALTLRTW